MVDLFFDIENYNYLTKILVPSLYLSIVSDNEEILESCNKKLEETIKKLIDINIIRWTYDLLKGVINNYGKTKEMIDRDNLVKYLEVGIEFYGERDFYWKNKFLELAKKF